MANASAAAIHKAHIAHLQNALQTIGDPKLLLEASNAESGLTGVPSSVGRAANFSIFLSLNL
jgi:hypothetical protein